MSVLKKIIGLIFAVGIISAFSISSSAYVQIIVSQGNLTTDQKSELTTAINSWNILNSYHVRFNQDGATRSPAKDLYCVVKFASSLSSSAGWVTDGDITINTRFAKTRDERVFVLLHELGHVLGQGHLGTGLMAATFSLDKSIGIDVQNSVHAMYSSYYSADFKGTIGIGRSATDGPGKLKPS